MGSKKEDFTGKVFNRLTVTGNAPSRITSGGNLERRVFVKCDCGNNKDIAWDTLKRERTKSCGCLAKEQKTDIKSGQNFTHWTVLKETEGYFDKKGEKADRSFLCKCLCGKEKSVNLQSLVTEQSKSCGCQGRPKIEKVKKVKSTPEDTEKEQWKESITFPTYYISTLGRAFSFKKQCYIKTENKKTFDILGKEKSKLKEMYKTFIGEYDEAYYYPYWNKGEQDIKSIKLREVNTKRVERLTSIYNGIKKRCYSEKNKSYTSYGGKGIKIGESFSTFHKFFDWAIENGYDNNLEIDRINSDKDYCSSNCQFLTKEENNLRNKKINLTLNDVHWIRSDEFSYAEALERFTCSYNVIRNIKEYITFKNVPCFQNSALQ